MNFIKRSKKGFALILVILIAAAMMIPVLMLLSSTIPRRTNVTGEAVSDRSLVLADSTVDHILDTINTFPFIFTTPPMEGETEAVTLEKIQSYLIAHYLSELNGGVANPDNPIESFNDIKDNVSTYLYNLDTQEYYAVWDNTNNKIDHVIDVGPDGSISQTGNIKNLSTNVVSSLPFTNIDADYKTDNLWVEIDTNTKYWPGEPDKWDITATAYLLSSPDIKRTIVAVASRGEIETNVTEIPGETTLYATGSWFTRDTSLEATTVYYSDFSGLYHTKVYFGRYETTRGMIRSDSNLYMGGWAEDPVYANGSVYDDAVDAPGFPNNNTGRFGSNKDNLAWAKANNYATEGYPAADWANGDYALFGSRAVRDFLIPDEDSLQDKAFPDYYVNGSATVVFSVEDGVGKVTINDVKYDMPPNGAIFVEGTAIVSGMVKGRCTVGASKIDIGGSIIYNTAPRVNEDDPIPLVADALGLISKNDITIPTSTFNANHHLRIDAAMLTVSGSFGIQTSAPWHYIDPSGTYEAWWNGCQAMWNTSNAPAIYLGGGKVRGYEIQHTYYDRNLFNFGPPPFYPLTNSYTDEHWTERYVPVEDSTIKGYLQGLTKDQLTETGNPDYPYMYEYGGITYYFNGTFTEDSTPPSYEGTGTMNPTDLYRIIWKEQIAQPVNP